MTVWNYVSIDNQTRGIITSISPSILTRIPAWLISCFLYWTKSAVTQVVFTDLDDPKYIGMGAGILFPS